MSIARTEEFERGSSNDNPLYLFKGGHDFNDEEDINSELRTTRQFQTQQDHDELISKGDINEINKSVAVADQQFIATDLYKRIPMKHFHYKSKNSLERLYKT